MKDFDSRTTIGLTLPQNHAVFHCLAPTPPDRSPGPEETDPAVAPGVSRMKAPRRKRVDSAPIKTHSRTEHSLQPRQPAFTTPPPLRNRKLMWHTEPSSSAARKVKRLPEVRRGRGRARGEGLPERKYRSRHVQVRISSTARKARYLQQRQNAAVEFFGSGLILLNSRRSTFYRKSPARS